MFMAENTKESELSPQSLFQEEIVDQQQSS